METIMSVIEVGIETVSTEVKNELRSAMMRYGSMKSGHEGYAVILEEMDELWDVIKVNPKKVVNPDGLKRDIRREAIQVAAMAMRFVIDVCDKEGK